MLGLATDGLAQLVYTAARHGFPQRAGQMCGQMGSGMWCETGKIPPTIFSRQLELLGLGEGGSSRRGRKPSKGQSYNTYATTICKWATSVLHHCPWCVSVWLGVQ